MKKKIFIFIAICCLVFCGLFIFDKWTTFPSYAYIADVIETDSEITFEISDGTGDNKYHHYELKDMGNGVYEFQLYQSFSIGHHYPKFIKIDNQNQQIKEIYQINLDKQIEMIYPYQ